MNGKKTMKAWQMIVAVVFAGGNDDHIIFTSISVEW